VRIAKAVVSDETAGVVVGGFGDVVVVAVGELGRIAAWVTAAGVTRPNS